MPEYSSTTITPADSVKVPAMNGSTSGNFQLDALKSFILASKGAANGLASLDSSGKLAAAQIPDSLDDVLIYASKATLPNPGTAGKLYITADTNEMYRWDDTLATPDYVVLSVDLSAYATKAEMEAADTDLKNALTAVDHRVQNLESAKGDYVPVDSTKGVISVPSGKGKWAVVEKLRGVTRGKNQLVQNYNFASGTTGFSPAGGTLSASGNVLSYTLTSIQENDYYNGISADSTGQHTVVGHTYLICADVTLPHTPASNHFNLYVGGEYIYFQPTANTKTKCVGIATAVNTNNAQIHVAPFVSDGYAVGDIVRIENWFIRDLTLYFGSTVPTLAEIQTYYPWLLSPSDYGTSLVDSVYEGVRSVFFNLWDEEWESGDINVTDGQKRADSARCRSKNFINVKPLTTYYSKTEYPNTTICCYDADGNWVSSEYQSGYFSGQNTTFTTPSWCHKIMLYYNGNTYNDDICINISGSLNGTYKPYHSPSTLSLPTPITLRSAGSVAEEAYLNEDGEAWKTNPLDNVDLGTLNWGYDSTYAFFYYLMNDRKEGIDFIADGYTNVGAVTDPNMANVPTMSIASNSVSGKWVYIKNTSKNASDLVNGHASWLEGVTLYYALATPNAPTQLTPIQNPTILTEAGGTISAQTEEPIDGNFSVGFITL